MMLSRERNFCRGWLLDTIDALVKNAGHSWHISMNSGGVLVVFNTGRRVEAG